jgi:hypothetical protein
MARFSGTSEVGIPEVFRSYADWNTWHIQESWNGKHIYIYGGNNYWDAVFIPDDGSLNLPIGFTFNIITDYDTYVYVNANDSNITNLSVVSVNYTPYGYDIPPNTMVTMMKIDSNRWIMSGYGITQD